jgi:hypothetical protein
VGRERVELARVHVPEGGFVAGRFGSEGMALVGDVVVDAVALDELRGAPPVGETRCVVRSWAECAEVWRWLRDVGVDELGDTDVDGDLDGR